MQKNVFDNQSVQVLWIKDRATSFFLEQVNDSKEELRCLLDSLHGPKASHWAGKYQQKFPQPKLQVQTGSI